MDIECSLIEVGNDGRAVICVGAEKRGHCCVKTTPPVDWINYRTKKFSAGGRLYYFDKRN